MTSGPPESPIQLVTRWLGFIFIFGSQSFGGFKTVGRIYAASFGSGDDCGTGPRLFKGIFNLTINTGFGPEVGRN